MTSIVCGRSGPEPACHRFASWTASASTSCSPSRSTTPPCAMASRKALASSCASTSIRGVSASRADVGSTTIPADEPRRGLPTYGASDLLSEPLLLLATYLIRTPYAIHGVPRRSLLGNPACRQHASPPTLYELTTPRRSASPPH